MEIKKNEEALGYCYGCVIFKKKGENALRQRKTLEIDGTMEVPAQEMMTFPYRLAKSGDYNNLTIFIPRQIKEALQLTANSLVQVAIKTITEQECKEIFIGVPNPKGTKAEPVRWNTRQYVRQCRGEMMNCPVCKKAVLYKDT